MISHQYLLKLLIPLFAIPLFVNAQGNESFSKIGESSAVSYVMYTDPSGNLFYLNTINNSLSLMKYELSTAKTTRIAANFSEGGGFGAVAPTVTGDTVYCLTHNSPASIYRLICSQGKSILVIKPR